MPSADEPADIERTRIRVFGGAGLDGPDGPISIGGPGQRRLLALLALRASSVVTNDWLAEHLWSDDERPEASTATLRTYVSRLRQALPESARPWIATAPGGYQLEAPASALEHKVFTQLRTDAAELRASGDPLAAHQRLDEALALWRGDPFPELEDFDFAWAEIEQLRLDRLEMLEERWETALALGRHTQIVGELAVFATEHRTRDRATRQYALALHRSGRTAEALRAVSDHRRVLAGESGLDPSPALVELEQAMLVGDDSLDVEQVGRPLRGYRLLDEIGSGAFSVVWRGMQPSVGREVAIKQIRSELASQPDFIRRFEAEAHLVARIEHPHIVPLIDYWRDPDSAYLVMRLLRGDTLERRLDDGPLTIEAAITLVGEIGGALSAAHAHGIIHRDVKTGNILFDDQGNSYLADFGIALEATQSTGPEAALSSGSPAYASPEQINRLSLGPEADVFSLGVVLFECLTGTLPFSDSSSVDELLHRQLHAPYPPVVDLRPDVPAHISDAIATATAKDPADRWPTVAEFVDAVQTPAAASGITPQDPLPRFTGIDLANPYKGLRAFDDADVETFFGRERLVTEMVDRLAGDSIQSRCVIAVGPSGSGKSSVVRAGLVPAIRRGAVPESTDWFTTTMVPGAHPYEALEAALLRIALNPPESLLGQLKDGDRGILRTVRRCLASDQDRALLVIDQFEEIFTESTPEEAEHFLTALATALEDSASPLRLVATLRADYYHRPLAHRSFARVLKETSVDVTPLAPDELERAIVEPARHLGVHFEAGLAPRIAAESLGQPAPLPLLQYALSELFDRREDGQLTIEAYEQIGGLSGALGVRAEAIYSDAPSAQQPSIRRMFGRMTSPGQTSVDLRRRIPLADLGDDVETADAIKAFGDARLITFDRDVATREPTVEVAHEALLREWPRLVTWLEEDADLLRSTDAVAAAASTWDEGGRHVADLYRGGRLEAASDLALTAPEHLRTVDTEFIEASRSAAEAEHRVEQHRVKRLRRLVAGVGVALVLALVAGGIAVRQQQLANDKTTLAVEASREAELATLISQSAAAAVDDEELAILLALEAHRQQPGADTEQAVLRALASSTLANRVSSLGPPIDLPGCVGSLGIESRIQPFNNDILVYSGAATEFAQRGNELISRDTVSGEITEHGPSPAPCVSWLGNAPADRRAAITPDGTLFLGSFDGPWTVEREFGSRLRVPARPAFNPMHRLLLLAEREDGVDAILVDDMTGETVGAPITAPGAPAGGRMSPDGTFAAVGFDGGGGESAGVIVIVDGENGDELHRIDGITPARFAFDDLNRELLVGADDGSIATVDLESGAVVTTVRTASTSDLLDIGIRFDGLLVVSSTNQVEIVDRRSGPTGERIDIPASLVAELRSDGRLFTVNDTQTAVETYDLDENAITERSIELSSTSIALFTSGEVVVTDIATSAVESIDLATGNRVEVPLITPAGDAFDAAVVFRNERGFVAVSPDAQIARWEEGVMVDRVALAEPGGRFDGGSNTLSDGALLIGVSDGAGEPSEIHLVDTNSAELDLVTSVSVDDLAAADIGNDREIHTLSSDGTMRTYDRSGVLVDELDVGLVDNGRATTADFSEDAGLIAFGGPDGAVIVEPSTGEVTRLTNLRGAVTTLVFAQEGRLLVIGSGNGTVSTWDVDQNVSRGVIWRGPEQLGFGTRYDAETDSLWLSERQRLVRLPLNPEVFLERACEVVSRDLTQDEWDLFVPGDDPLQSACD